jgi:hypothetical protein
MHQNHSKNYFPGNSKKEERPKKVKALLDLLFRNFSDNSLNLGIEIFGEDERIVHSLEFFIVPKNLPSLSKY